MTFVRDWLKNLILMVLAVVAVGIFMFVFVKIFYPELIGMFQLTWEATVGFINVLKLWPIVVLAVIVSAMPRRWRRAR